jgi:hypothetical protein
VVQTTSRVTPAISDRSSTSDWYLDSGSYYHYINDINDFVDNKYVTVDSGVMVRNSRILKGYAPRNIMLPIRGIDGTRGGHNYAIVTIQSIIGLN